MNDDRFPISKVLVLETDADASDHIRHFCDTHRLQGLRAGRNNILSVLRSNVDLGGVSIPERLGDDALAGIALARQLQAARPELPFFLRRESENGLQGLACPGRDAAS